MPEFYMILARKKLSKYPNFYDICPKILQNSQIFHDFCPENAIILHNNCPKIFFPNFREGARAPCPPVFYAYGKFHQLKLLYL